MKLLKEILIFVVFTGIIFGVFTIVTKDKETVNTEALTAGNHEQLLKEIDRDWNDLNNWNEDTYNRHLTMVAQSHNAGIINELDSHALVDRINKLAYQKCVSAMNREFGRADCNPKLLAENYGGLQTILMNERGLSSNGQIVEVTKVYNLYNRIIAFNKKSLDMSPQFNGNKGTWNSWDAHQDRILKQANELISDPIYSSRLKGINDIAEIKNTHSKLAESRGKFYDRLNDQMYNYYSGQCDDLMTKGVNMTDSELHEAKTALQRDINGVRVKLANEKYASPSHPIFNRLYSMIKRVDSIKITTTNS